MIIIILLSTVALYFYFRARGRLRRLRGLGPVVLSGGADTDSLDERAPLGGEAYELDTSGGFPVSPRKGAGASIKGYDPLQPQGDMRKGKGRARDLEEAEEGGEREGEVVFALGDEEEEEDGGHRSR